MCYGGRHARDRRAEVKGLRIRAISRLTGYDRKISTERPLGVNGFSAKRLPPGGGRIEYPVTARDAVTDQKIRYNCVARVLH